MGSDGERIWFATTAGSQGTTLPSAPRSDETKPAMIQFARPPCPDRPRFSATSVDRPNIHYTSAQSGTEGTGTISRTRHVSSATKRDTWHRPAPRTRPGSTSMADAVGGADPGSTSRQIVPKRKRTYQGTTTTDPKMKTMKYWPTY